MTRRRFILTAAGILIPALPRIVSAQGPFVDFRPRTRKPPFGSVQVNWGHPLAAGLTDYWLLAEGAGQAVNLVTDVRSTSTAIPPGVVGPGGMSRSFDGGTSNRFLDGRVRQYGNGINYSVWCRCRATAGDAFQNPLDSDDGASLRVFQLRFSNTNQYNFITFNTGGGNSNASGGTLTLNVDTSLSGTANADLATVYQDGIAQHTSSFGAGTLASNNDTIRIGKYLGGTTTQPFTGQVYACARWQRVLLAPEMRWLHIEPYAFLQPIPAVTYAFMRTPAAAPAGPGAPPLRTLMGVGR